MEPNQKRENIKYPYYTCDSSENNPNLHYQAMELSPEVLQLLTRIFFAVTREFINYLESKSIGYFNKLK